ncbi:MAG: efflux transporter outer membrane subunit [Pseudomonadota bacterium]
MKHIVVASLIVLVAGCAQYARPPDLPALTEPSLPDVPPAWQVAQESLGDVAVGWIATLGDPVLTTLVEEAQANNRDLQAALAALEQSRAIVRQARAALLPAIDYSLSGAQGGRVSDDSSDAYSAGLSLGWELDVWGRVRASRNAAAYGAASAEADYVFAQYSLAASVAQTYFFVIESALQEDVAQKNFDALTETARIVGAQRELGAADAYDESLARSNLATAQATLLQAAGAKRLAQRALEVLVGRYPADALTTRPDLPARPPIPLAGVPSDLLERRPDIIAAEMAVASAFSTVGATKATRLPTFSLSGSLQGGGTQFGIPGGTAASLGDALDADNSLWSLAVNLLGPLFDAGLRRAQIDEATEAQRQAVANYASTALNAFQEVENSLDQNTVIAARVIALREAAEAQNRALELAQLRYQEGETNLLDVLQVQSTTLSADSALVTVRREQLDEWIALNLALGGSWQTP